jgi:16S rRNA (cytosine1402-N4)-methyltransferase
MQANMPERTNGTNGTEGTDGTAGKRSANPARQPAAPKVHFRWIATLSAFLAAGVWLLSQRPPPASGQAALPVRRRASARPGGTGLEKVTVLRNDLSDADLVVVAVQPQAGGLPRRPGRNAPAGRKSLDARGGALGQIEKSGGGTAGATPPAPPAANPETHVRVPAYFHKSVLTTEVLAALRPGPGGRYVDGTVGGGGHAEALLRASAPTGDCLAATGMARRCRRPGPGWRSSRDGLKSGRAVLPELDQWIEAGSCDGVVLDLGVSSPQLDWPERGFSFQSDGPLDMRMDPGQELTAEALLNQTGAGELARIFWEYGGESNSRRIARAIEREREARPLRRTRQLAELIEKVSPRGGRKSHPATKVFQALRMAVNDEMGHLQRGLEAAVSDFETGRPAGGDFLPRSGGPGVEEFRRPAGAGLRSRRTGRAGTAAAASGDFAVGAAQGDQARRGGIERKPAQPQRAMPGAGKIVKKTNRKERTE